MFGLVWLGLSKNDTALADWMKSLGAIIMPLFWKSTDNADILEARDFTLEKDAGRAVARKKGARAGWREAQE